MPPASERPRARMKLSSVPRMHCGRRPDVLVTATRARADACAVWAASPRSCGNAVAAQARVLSA
eukprot:6182253-Pleurochrysis_carterae.AAC.2